MLFFGGNFWDSRATGFELRNPAAQQAHRRPVDTQEMGFPDTACVAFRLAHAVYRPLFEEIWGKGSLDINFPPETEQICATPGGIQTAKSSIRLNPSHTDTVFRVRMGDLAPRTTYYYYPVDSWEPNRTR